jgi:hypothetical protein
LFASTNRFRGADVMTGIGHDGRSDRWAFARGEGGARHAALTSTQKKILRSEYKKAAARMSGGVSQAWGREAVRALRRGELGTEKPRTTAVSPPTNPTRDRLTWSLTALGAFVVCFVCLGGLRPVHRPIPTEALEAGSSAVSEPMLAPQQVVPAKIATGNAAEARRGIEVVSLSEAAGALRPSLEPSTHSPREAPATEQQPNASLGGSADLTRPPSIPRFERSTFVGYGALTRAPARRATSAD